MGSYQWIKDRGDGITCFRKYTLNVLWGMSQGEHRAEKFTRKVIPGGQVRQDGGWNQKVNAARKGEMDRLEIYLKVDLKGLGIDQMRRVRKESGVLEACAGCFVWETGVVNTTH